MFTVCLPCNGVCARPYSTCRYVLTRTRGHCCTWLILSAGQLDCSSTASGCDVTFNCQSSGPEPRSIQCTIDGNPLNCKVFSACTRVNSMPLNIHNYYIEVEEQKNFSSSRNFFAVAIIIDYRLYMYNLCHHYTAQISNYVYMYHVCMQVPSLSLWIRVSFQQRDIFLLLLLPFRTVWSGIALASPGVVSH